MMGLRWEMQRHLHIDDTNDLNLGLAMLVDVGWFDYKNIMSCWKISHVKFGHFPNQGEHEAWEFT